VSLIILAYNLTSFLSVHHSLLDPKTLPKPSLILQFTWRSDEWVNSDCRWAYISIHQLYTHYSSAMWDWISALNNVHGFEHHYKSDVPSNIWGYIWGYRGAISDSACVAYLSSMFTCVLCYSHCVDFVFMCVRNTYRDNSTLWAYLNLQRNCLSVKINWIFTLRLWHKWWDYHSYCAPAVKFSCAGEDGMDGKSKEKQRGPIISQSSLKP